MLGEGQGKEKKKKSLLWAKNIMSLPLSPIPAQVKTCDEIQLLKSNAELLETMKASSVSDISQNFHCSR